MRTKTKGKRRKSRECALQNLFIWDVTGENPEELFYFSHEIGVPQDEIEEWKSYSQRLFKGVIEHQKNIDHILKKYSKHWKVERMGKVDRNILRLAVFELMHCPDVPRAAIINEAVEMAKAYGDTESSVFINGNLDQICRKEIFPDDSSSLPVLTSETATSQSTLQ
jgi:transcription antitermination protein NusB